ncbi:MAG: prepilin-type N-terminal cleavage/methylation domain-containing protein [Verrucomicrobiota bacterium]|jgi:prepilin-type N-terminal cleavage/methylation domain-containing protein
MKPRCSNQRNHALTLTEVLVSVAVVCVLTGVAYLALHRPKVVHRIVHQNKSSEIQCVNNLKQIGLAFRIWEGDNGNQLPMRVPSKKGGAMEPALRGNVAPIFQVMSNELSTPRILLCPADADRSAAKDFTIGFDNSKVSYFAGVDAADDKPAMFLSGDENFAIGSRPVKSGLLLLATNAPVSWTAARHMDQGNIGLADGAVQTTSSSLLRELLVQTGVATNRLALP